MKKMNKDFKDGGMKMLGALVVLYTFVYGVELIENAVKKHKEKKKIREQLSIDTKSNEQGVA